MDRRSFVGISAGGLLAGALPAEGQQARPPYRIGMLETTSFEVNRANVDAFKQALRSLGYAEGRQFVVEYRSADGQDERFASLAGELVRLRVDLIVTRGTPAALAAKKATSTIPVVMASSGDPVATGLVATLARPGGNVTGLSAFATEIQGKQLEVLKQMVPGITRVGFLFNMTNPVLQAQWAEAEVAARGAGLQPQLLDVRVAHDLKAAFDAAVGRRVGALIVGIDALTQANRALIVEAAIAPAARDHVP